MSDDEDGDEMSDDEGGDDMSDDEDGEEIPLCEDSESEDRASEDGDGISEDEDVQEIPLCEDSHGEEFSVHLRKSPGAVLGVEWTEDPLHHLLVKEVFAGGLVDVWNQQNSTCQIRPGDELVEVNGLRGEASQLVEEIRGSNEPCFTMRRGEPSPDAPTESEYDRNADSIDEAHFDALIELRNVRTPVSAMAASADREEEDDAEEYAEMIDRGSESSDASSKSLGASSDDDSVEAPSPEPAKGKRKGKPKGKAKAKSEAKKKGKGKGKGKASENMVPVQGDPRWLGMDKYCKEPWRMSDPLEPCKYMFVFRREKKGEQWIDKALAKRRHEEAKKKETEQNVRKMRPRKKTSELTQVDRFKEYKRVAKLTYRFKLVKDSYEEDQERRTKAKEAIASMSRMRGRKEWEPGDPPRIRYVSRVVTETTVVRPGREIKLHSLVEKPELNGKEGVLLESLPDNIWRVDLDGEVASVNLKNIDVLQDVDQFAEFIGVEPKDHFQSLAAASSREVASQMEQSPKHKAALEPTVSVLEEGTIGDSIHYSSFDTQSAWVEEVANRCKRPNYPAKKVCVVTGGYGKYVHPKTGLRYANKEAYARLQHVYNISGKAGCLKAFGPNTDEVPEAPGDSEHWHEFTVSQRPRGLDPAISGVALRTEKSYESKFGDLVLKWGTTFVGSADESTGWVELKANPNQDYKFYAPSMLQDGTVVVRSSGLAADDVDQEVTQPYS